MHDNDPCHSLKKVKLFLVYNKVQVMDWPAQILDLNSIEGIWKIISGSALAQDLKIQEELLKSLDT